MAPKTERFELRLELGTIERIDNWASRQPDRPSRSDAVRRLVERALETRIDDGDRLVIMMLRDIQKALKIDNLEIDSDFVAEAVMSGHYWALDWKYPGLFHERVDNRQVLHEVVEVLDMWSFIEEGYGALSAAEKARIKKEAAFFGKYPEFTGFDGNNEAEHRSIALFLVEKMGRFTMFKGRDMDAHHRTLDLYSRMLKIFEPIRMTRIGCTLTADQIIAILKATAQP